MLPKLITRIPGPRSRRLAGELSRVESPNVTFMGPPGPIFWKSARGANVWDVDGNRYLDLTAAFGVASLGHTSSRVRNAIGRQSSRLVHGMGDVHPTELKVRLLKELSRITFERWTHGRVRAQSVLCNSGFEAVETALKTALLHTGRPGILAFQGGYHGLGYGALMATWRKDFRRPFRSQIPNLSFHLPYPVRENELPAFGRRLEQTLRAGRIGAVVVEVVQGRAGVRISAEGLLPLLRRACDRWGAALIVDEVFTGFWRTGRMFAVEHAGVVPDLLCLGKALSGALPISACVGRSSVMKAWPRSDGEAIHTSTFLGNPLACAAALESIRQWSGPRWAARVRALNRAVADEFHKGRVGRRGGFREVRGLGLLVGVEMEAGRAPDLARRLLERGIIVLPAGNDGEVLSITPALTIPEGELRHAVREILSAMRARK